MAESVISVQEQRLAQATTPRERALALVELVDLLAHRDPARARQLGDSALGAALAADDSWLEARARLSRANALLGAADVGRVLDEMQTAMRTFEALGDRRARAWALVLIAALHVYSGDGVTAAELLHEVLPEIRKRGDLAVLARALNELANAHAIQDDPVRALQLYREAADTFRSAGDNLWMAFVLQNAAYVHCGLGDRALAAGNREEAEVAYGRALALTREAAELPNPEDNVIRAYAEGMAGRALIGLGQPLAALDHLKAAVLTARTAGDRRAEGAHLIETARALDAAGRTQDGLRAALRAVHLLEEVGDRRTLAQAIEVSSTLNERVGDLAAALAAQRRFHALSQELDGERAKARMELNALRLDVQQAQAEAERRRTEALMDPVTGLPNRRDFDAQFGLLIARSTGPVALALMDLDHFKKVNDRFSHLVGDDVLRVCARLLRESSRDRDLVARFGGEEFAIVLPGAELPIALVVCERMRRAIADYPWETIHEGLAVTASLGCIVGMPGTTTQEMLTEADRQLYAAKAAGRNRVMPEPGTEDDA
jgi:diguanylate cyclase (GGDEF)-like protein